MQKVLVVGRGAREHALAWKFSQTVKVYAAPGSKGMEDVATLVPINENDFSALSDFALKEGIDLTVIGPEAPLVNGIVDHFEAAGLRCFGPKANAAIIEGSKSFAKDLMKRHNIPTAAYEVFNDYEAACLYIKQAAMPIVLKVDGLAAGKGVVIARTNAEAEAALKDMMKDAKFGEENKKVVVEEFLEGEEFSLTVFVSGDIICPMVIAQDHKHIYEGDKGPNTGGVGAYSPVPQLNIDLTNRAMEEIILPLVKAMQKEGRPFSGFLYAGLIATKTGPKVIEFNARFGDPETEVILPRLENDLFQIIMDILSGKPVKLSWTDEAVLGVVLCSKGYPGKYETGSIINGLDKLNKETLVFHFGTAYTDNNWVTNGGRILFVACKGKTIKEAENAVYKEIEKITYENMYYRRDIGFKALA